MNEEFITVIVVVVIYFRQNNDEGQQKWRYSVESWEVGDLVAYWKLNVRTLKVRLNTHISHLRLWTKLQTLSYEQSPITTAQLQSNMDILSLVLLVLRRFNSVLQPDIEAWTYLDMKL